MWKISDGRLDWLVVFATVDGQPVPMGALSFEGKGQRRQSVFRYARSWLDRADGYAPAPVGLALRARGVASHPHEVPLPFYDAAPDGWGRGLLTMAFPDQVFGMGEFLAAAGGDRVGELRFGSSPEDGPRQWEPGQALLDLPDGTETLEALVDAAEAADQGRATHAHLRLLFRSSADIGGARPKTHLRRDDGSQWIAKFRAWGDAFDDPRMECVCLGLARACGIDVPDHELVDVAGRSVLLVRRFDRAADCGRLGYLSAATLMGAAPSSYAVDTSYAELANKARGAGIAPCEADLFRRLLFNCIIHNTDDHLRNTAFCRRDGQWRLSPAFDLVPCRSPRLVLRPARGVDPHPDVATALEAHAQFRLTREAAEAILDEVRKGLAELPDLFDRLEVSARDREVVGEIAPTLRVQPPPSANWTPT